MRNFQPLNPLFSASLWPLSYTCTHKIICTCTFPSPFTLRFLSGPIFFCESHSCSVGRGLSSTSGKRQKTEFFNISQEELQLQLPVPASSYRGLDMQPQAGVSQPHHSPQGHQLPPVFRDKCKCLFQVPSLLRCSMQRQQRGWETQLEGEVFNQEFRGEGVRPG